MKYTIYKTTNIVNQKIYIGAHMENGRKYLGSGTYLKRAIKKYGKENFIKEILFRYNTADEMFEKEYEIVNKEFINRSDTYNLRTGGDGFNSIDIIGSGNPMYGRKHSEETKKKISESLTGKIMSEAVRKKMSESSKNMLHSEETKRKMSEWHKGKIVKQETRDKIRKARTKKVLYKDKIFTVLELSNLLKVSKRTIYRRIKSSNNDYLYH